MDIQETFRDEAELNLRIGIHIGDVLFNDGDILGDGVNIASRIEHEAPSGEILISEAVYTNIKNQGQIRSEFFKEENELGLTRAYCDLDKLIADLVPNVVELRRQRTLAKGDSSCDFYYYEK